MLRVWSLLLLFFLLSGAGLECGATVPGPPTDVHATPISTDQINVTWSEPASSRMGPGPAAATTLEVNIPSVVSLYTVFWTSASGIGNSSTPLLQYTIMNLAECRVYNVAVSAWADDEMGSPSETVDAITFLTEVKNIVISQSGRDVTVRWTWNPASTFMEPVVYTVSWNNTQLDDAASVNETQYTIVNITVENELLVCVMANCSNCRSPLVCDKFQPPKSNPPDLPLILGLSIGIPAAIIIVSLIVYQYQKHHKKKPLYGGGTENTNNQLGLDNMGFRDPSSTEALLRNEFQIKFANQEYKKPIVQGLRHTDRNRYADILPFDDTLVKVKHVEYINASRVLEKFIATQDPYPDQDDDFWQLIWDCDVHVIIRLSMDTSKHATARYIDDRGENTWVMGHDELSVSLMDSDNNGSFWRRTLAASKGEEVRVIQHFHMTDWPEGSVPDPQHVLTLVMAARTDNHAYKTSPVLVHCGAGCGRTGTIIAIWHLLDEFLADRMANIVRTVEMMRECRMSMVQTEDQYVFIYKCFEDFKEKRGIYEAQAATYEVLR